MKIRALLSWFTIFLLSLLVAVSCTRAPSPTSTSSPSDTPAATPIQMGYSAWPGWFPWKVAQDEGLFKANNIDVELKWFVSYIDSINAMAANKLDANTQTLDETVSSVANGADQVVVLVNDNSTGNDKIIVREGINSIADLKGKKVAAEQGTVDHFLLLLGMKEDGLTQADIQFQPLETGAAAAAFVAGRVDAVGVYAPHTTTALKRPGSKELFTSKQFPGAIPDHLVVSRQMINERPQDIQALVDTWFATLDFIQKNREKAYETMAKQADVTIEEYKEYDAGTKIFTLEENLQAFKPGKDMKSLPFAAQEINKFLVEGGLTKQEADLSKIFDDRFVQAYAEKSQKS